MKLTDELRALIPEELRPIARFYWNEKQQTFYFYRLDGVKYDKSKKRGIDVRTPLGKIKDGHWTYSPSFLKLRHIEELKGQLGSTQKDVNAETAENKAQHQPAKQTSVAKDLTDRELSQLLSITYLAILCGRHSAEGIFLFCLQYQAELELLYGPYFDRDLPTAKRFEQLLCVLSAALTRPECKALIQSGLKPAAERLRSGSFLRAQTDAAAAEHAACPDFTAPQQQSLQKLRAALQTLQDNPLTERLEISKSCLPSEIKLSLSAMALRRLLQRKLALLHECTVPESLMREFLLSPLSALNFLRLHA